MTDRPTAATGWTSCAAVARRLAEPPAGTGAVAVGWIAVEHDDAWSPDAPSTAELGEVLAALTAPDVRVQLVRRPRRARAATEGVSRDPVREAPPDGGRTVLLGHAAVAPGRRWLRRLEVVDLDDLAARVRPAAVTSSTPPPFGEPVDHDVWLVCTHGRRDACCAVHGRPVAAALEDDGVDVWETTHTGGHRFAATAVVLPDGLSLARLDDGDPVGTARALARGELPARLLRGRCAVPRPVQAAEALARVMLASTHRDALLPTSWSTDDDETSVVLAGEGDRSWVARVLTRPVDEPREISDRADPTTPPTHRILSLVEE